MVQGDEYNIDITITSEDVPLDIDDIEVVEVRLSSIRKCYPGAISYSDGVFHIPISQSETLRLTQNSKMQVRVKFKSGDVIGSEAMPVDVAYSLSKEIL